ncbi:hypothetical protein [Flavobacterium sp. K5-23]|uniref:hypothetical protein n=1 Tax=Flavobacterium sp. K5-23 TaxID=2746225 RepID=UPI00200F3F4B|nr:hypothetical protein [Flavobacterium sp. K5-23]UQD56785.1 hypothetical protein FLAK523_10440 [Flavobacterium sp. K5-23]
MKNIVLYSLFFGLLFSNIANAQDGIKLQDKYTAHNKGKFFFSWGGNREVYSKSDITFKGKDYDFTLNDVSAHDRPKGWHIDYINPARMTIPQTNFRMGYFINDHYSIAIGVDHMKYVMNQDIAVALDGYYPKPGTYGEILTGNQVLLTREFLTFEHTDGLNYVNTEISRHDDISSIFKIGDTDKVQINLTEGAGVGLLYPKTNAKLLGKDRHDDFHVSGYGASLKAGLNVTFFKHFYIQGELKGGYINMQDIKTTNSGDDSASQDFFFFQKIIAFGGIFKI